MKSRSILTLLLLAALGVANGCSKTASKSEVAVSPEKAGISDAERRNAIMARLRKDSFDRGASVYIGTVLTREPSPQSDQHEEFGKVTLSVVKTLRGPSRQTLVLPYSFAVGFIMNGTNFAWPPFDVGDNLVCVVVPGGVNPGTPPIPDLNEGASFVVFLDKDQAKARQLAVRRLHPDLPRLDTYPVEAGDIEALCAEYNAKTMP